jgi:hypothetical protein
MEDTKTLGEGTIPEPDRATPRKKRSTMGRILQITGLVFIAAALALGGYIWWNLWGTGFATQRAQEDLRPAFERNLASLAPADAPDRVVKVPGKAVAIIRIPKIDVDYVVVEGTDTEALKKGPGHYSDTAYPWEDTGAWASRDTGRRTARRSGPSTSSGRGTGSCSRPSTGSSTTGSRARSSPPVGDPAVGLLGPASDGGPEPRPDHLQPAVLGVDQARGDRRPRRLAVASQPVDLSRRPRPATGS